MKGHCVTLVAGQENHTSLQLWSAGFFFFFFAVRLGTVSERPEALQCKFLTGFYCHRFGDELLPLLFKEFCCWPQLESIPGLLLELSFYIVSIIVSLPTPNTTFNPLSFQQLSAHKQGHWGNGAHIPLARLTRTSAGSKAS